MNTPRSVSQWITALQFLANDKSTSDALQSRIKTVLTAYERADKLQYEQRTKTSALLLELRTAEKELCPQLVRDLENGKRPTLDANVAQIALLKTAWETSQASLTATTNAHNQITNQVCGYAIKPFADELLLWVAQRRDSEPVTCGEIDALPAPVQLIYKAIEPLWRTDWELALSLGTTLRLPLIYNAQWTVEYRASLAWVWSQVAQGNIHKVPAANAKGNDAPAQYLAPTHRVMTLPTVPPVPAAPPQNRFRSF
jgi:hypothetical protein